MRGDSGGMISIWLKRKPTSAENAAPRLIRAEESISRSKTELASAMPVSSKKPLDLRVPRTIGRTESAYFFSKYPVFHSPYSGNANDKIPPRARSSAG